MSTVLASRAVNVLLNYIPLNIAGGYGRWDCGKAAMPGGEFLFYASILLSSYANFSTEMVSAANMLLTEVPCDENGNILLKSNWLPHQKSAFFS